MPDKTKDRLNKKHLLIVGKSAMERRNFITELINNSNFDTFRFPTGMKTIDEYLDYVRKNNLYVPWYSKKGKFNDDQVLDFHWDWISENNALVVMEEIQELEETWKIDLLESYMDEVVNRKKGQKIIHLIISQENEDGLMDKLCEMIRPRENEKRTLRQVVEGSIEVVDMDILSYDE